MASLQHLADLQIAAAPVVYTSYDYSAPLRETRQVQLKFYQTKLIGLFTRVSKDLLETYMVGNGTGYSVSRSRTGGFPPD
jgi:beta-galactosidase